MINTGGSLLICVRELKMDGWDFLEWESTRECQENIYGYKEGAIIYSFMLSYLLPYSKQLEASATERTSQSVSSYGLH
jgi:hypothetical protein